MLCEDVLIEVGSCVAWDNLCGKDAPWSRQVVHAHNRVSGGWSSTQLPLLRGFPPLWAQQHKVTKTASSCGTITCVFPQRALWREWKGHVPSLFVTVSDIQIAQVETAGTVNLGYILVSKQQPEYPAYTQKQARTRQVKKGMKPSCKHFLSGREHFLNPGATESFLILHQTSPDSLFLSFPITLSL